MRVVAESDNSKVTNAIRLNHQAVYNKILQLLSAQQDLRLFARPNIIGNHTTWMVDMPEESSIRHFDQLSEEEKDTVADYLDDAKKKIPAILKSEPELARILNELFIVPSTKDIKVLATSGGGLQPVLTQWGYKTSDLSSSVDPLSFVIQRPRTTTAKVIIELRYTDGSQAADKVFYIEDSIGSKTREKANKDGFFDRGRCKLGTIMEVYDLPNGQKAHTHNFTITPDGQYVVIFPYLTEGRINVADQRGRRVTGAEIEVEIAGNKLKQISDSNGQIDLPGLEAGKSLRFFEAGKPENEQLAQIERQGNEWTLTVYRDLLADAQVRVVNELGDTLPNYAITIAYGDTSRDASTGEHGVLLLPNLEVGKSVKISDKNRPEFSAVFPIQESENDFILQVQPPEEKNVQVKLIDHKNKALPGVAIDFSGAKLKTSATTNEEGICTLAYDDFVHGEKIAAAVRLEIEQKGKRKEKLIRKKFRFRSEQLEYVLKIRKMNWWWLLLLLPLLLLIQCEKTVYVKTLDARSGQPAAAVNVSFGYERAFVFDDGRFLPTDWIDSVQKSDANGVSAFSGLRYSVYSWMFRHFSTALTFANTPCYASDTLQPVFHSIWNEDTLYLQLNPITTSLDFLVVDKEDNMPLPDAQVEIVVEYNGARYTDSGISGADGRVIFNSIPKCGVMTSLRGEADGYFPDSLSDKPVEELLKGALEKERILRLTPKKGQFSFFVVDCKSKKPIAGATVTIEIDYNGQKTTKTKHTNVDGKGKGFSEDYLIAKIHLSGKAPYYKPGELPDWHFIKDFTNPALYPDEKRTFCLEPAENCVTFKNTDEKTGQPLAGVKNTVTIRNGSNTRTDTVISSRDGTFPVCGIIVGDKVSILAQYPPDYEDNDSSIVDKDGVGLQKSGPSERTIPLKPKEIDLVFRTTDAEDGSIVDNTDLAIVVDGQPWPSPSSSGSGEFTVRVPVTAVISINASKTGYGSNNTTIQQKPAKSLMPPTPQSERDIPLQKDIPPPPPNAQPCNQPIKSSNGNSGEMSFFLGNKDYNMQLEFDFQAHPDEIIIYCGSGTSGSILFRRVLTNNIGSPITIPFNAKACNGVITVVIEPTEDDQSSFWSFTISCPE